VGGEPDAQSGGDLAPDAAEHREPFLVRPLACDGSSKLQCKRSTAPGNSGQRSLALSHTVMTKSQDSSTKTSSVFAV